MVSSAVALATASATASATTSATAASASTEEIAGVEHTTKEGIGTCYPGYKAEATEGSSCRQKAARAAAGRKMAAEAMVISHTSSS